MSSEKDWEDSVLQEEDLLDINLNERSEKAKHSFPRFRFQVGDSSTLNGVCGYRIERVGEGCRFTVHVHGFQEGARERSFRSSAGLGEKQQAILSPLLSPAPGSETPPIVINFWNRLKTRYLACVYLEDPRVTDHGTSREGWERKHPYQVIHGLADRLIVSTELACGIEWMSVFSHQAERGEYRWNRWPYRDLKVETLLNVQWVHLEEGNARYLSFDRGVYSLHEDGEGMHLNWHFNELVHGERNFLMVAYLYESRVESSR